MAKEFTKDERVAARRLLASLELWKSYRATMPVQYVFAFFAVALNEGKTVGEYARELGVAPSVMSRHFLDLGIRKRDKLEDGYGLVETRPNIQNLREHSVWLTPKGRSFFHQSTRVLID